ncbi:MAG TPA: beta-galactosidase trimerization domain-containing protein, partial [Armatimonadota bacterium]|nr:beta-galactosidase trimerization domain-containing protein [Armatimonadota bacterium]
DYAGYEMKPDDLLEWVSQAMRCGASHIEYYQNDNPRFTDPERWKMMLHLSKTLTSMNAVKLPSDPEVAILYSADSHRAEGPSTKANEIYTAYSLLGERVGSWFDFVDDDSLARGEKSLAKYRAVYIPLATYQRKAVVRQIEKFVKGGGTVISGDPTVFSWDIDGSDVSSVRERIFGIKVTGQKPRDSVLIRKSEWTEGVSGSLPIYRPVGRDGWPEDNGCMIEKARQDVQVIGTFTDGSPAITVVKYGKGRAVYFAANPFVPECVFAGDRWDGLFRAFQTHLGAKTNRPIWRFRLPPPD